MLLGVNSTVFRELDPPLGFLDKLHKYLAIVLITYPQKLSSFIYQLRK